MEAKKLNKYEQILATAISQKEWLSQKIVDKSYLIRPQSKGKKAEDDKFKKGQSEKKVVKECNEYLKDLKYTVVTITTGGVIAGNKNTGYHFASNSSSGMPDALVFNLFTKIKFWIEYKRNSGGIISQEQLNMHALLRACGDIVLIVTSLPDLKLKLSQYGL